MYYDARSSECQGTLYSFSIDCPLCIDLISLYKPDVLFMYCIYKIIIIIIICILFYCQESFCAVPIVMLMTRSISTLMDLWNAEYLNNKQYTENALLLVIDCVLSFNFFPFSTSIKRITGWPMH